MLKAKQNCLRVPTNDFAIQKCITRRKNPSSSKPSWKSRKKPPKGRTKNISFCNRICHILSSTVESSEEVVFDSVGSSFMVDNFENAHI